jgi:hypothetical protein
MYQQIAALEVASENPTTVTIFFFTDVESIQVEVTSQYIN